VSRIALIAGIMLAGAAAYGTMLPAPPWAAQQRGPTCSYEITVYLADTLPYLDPELRERVADTLEHGASPAYALALVQAARWQARIAADTAPWDLSADDTCAADAQLRHNLAALGSQLDVLTASSVTSQPPLSVRATLSALRLLEELKQRVANTNDPLGDLDEYAPLFRLRGAPMTIFWWAQRMFWYENKVRTEPLFNFLLDARNPDDFTIGAAHFFTGMLCEQLHNDPARAFSYYLGCVSHKTCLVFIGEAYCNAARIVSEMGQRENALALLAVDVPSIDMVSLRARKHLMAANILLDALQYSNGVKHLQAALAADSNVTQAVNTLVRSFYINAALWQCMLTNTWTEAERDAAILTGLTNACATPDDQAFLRALSLDWPPLDALPQAIVTNRTLNNVVFPVPIKQFELRRSDNATNPVPSRAQSGAANPGANAGAQRTICSFATFRFLIHGQGARQCEHIAG